MKINEFFVSQEFVDPTTYQRFGDSAIWFIDQRVIDGITAIRKALNLPITVNNWHKGGQFKYRGFRPKECTEGAEMSQHRYGRATDVEVIGMTPQQLYQWILDNWVRLKLYLYFTTLEDIAFTAGWLHIDNRNTGIVMLNGPLIVRP